MYNSSHRKSRATRAHHLQRKHPYRGAPEIARTAAISSTSAAAGGEQLAAPGFQSKVLFSVAARGGIVTDEMQFGERQPASLRNIEIFFGALS